MIEITDATLHFIASHLHDDVQKLALQRHKFPEVDFGFALQQIEGKRKGMLKFPSLARHEHFIFPKSLSMEQCSSESTARYKADLLAGKTVLDITGGLGIDDLFIAEKAQQITSVEENAELAEIALHNSSVLGIQNLEIFSGDGLAFVQNTARHFDCIYVDPARRNNASQKVLLLQDCVPNVLTLQVLLFSKTDFILLKASPMLDISRAIAELGTVAEVHCIAVKNECKELLFVCRPASSTSIQFKCANILSEDSKNHYFEFFESDERNAVVTYASEIGKYLYEPNVSILKAGAFQLAASRFALHKLAKDSHLYTSDRLFPDFPGRIFEVQSVFALNEQELKHQFPDRRAAIISRNFPLKADEIRKKFRFEDSDTTYLLVSSLSNGKKVAIKGTRIK